jgi:hypothetical protein
MADQLTRHAAKHGASVRLLIVLNAILIVAVLYLMLGGFGGGKLVLAGEVDTLRVREVIVVDSNGIERVRLGTRLPDAIINGERVHRGEQAAGLLLYDDTGQERGGYVTFSPSRTVALTLDTRKRQVALFAADADDGAVARLNSGSDWVELRTGGDGTRLSVGQSGKLSVQLPPMSAAEIAASCNAFKAELDKLPQRPPDKVLLEACMQRMPEKVCRECLGIR